MSARSATQPFGNTKTPAPNDTLASGAQKILGDGGVKADARHLYENATLTLERFASHTMVTDAAPALTS